MDMSRTVMMTFILLLVVPLAAFPQAMQSDDSGLGPAGGSSGPGFGDHSDFGDQNAPTPVPEPATMILLGSGVIGLLAMRKTHKR